VKVKVKVRKEERTVRESFHSRLLASSSSSSILKLAKEGEERLLTLVRNRNMIEHLSCSSPRWVGLVGVKRESLTSREGRKGSQRARISQPDSDKLAFEPPSSAWPGLRRLRLTFLHILQLSVLIVDFTLESRQLLSFLNQQPQRSLPLSISPSFRFVRKVHPSIHLSFSLLSAFKTIPNPTQNPTLP